MVTGYGVNSDSRNSFELIAVKGDESWAVKVEYICLLCKKRVKKNVPHKHVNKKKLSHRGKFSL